MIDQRRLFILGNSLLTDGLVHLLNSNHSVDIIGSSYIFEDVKPLVENGQLDILVIAGVNGFFEELAGELVRNNANISVLFVYPDKSYMELLKFRQVIASYADLVTVIETIR